MTVIALILLLMIAIGILAVRSRRSANKLTRLEMTLRAREQAGHEQAVRLAQAEQSLDLLHEIAANVDHASTLDDLLTRFLRRTMGIVNAHAACVRLVNPDGDLCLVASIGLDAEQLRNDHAVALRDMNTTQAEGLRFTPSHDAAGPVTVIALPLCHGEKRQGVCQLHSTSPEIAARADIRALLDRAGKHLGAAVERSRVESETRRLTLMQERNMLSHELHDSLAQSLASLRFRIRMLNEILTEDRQTVALTEARVIESGLDHAYAELRELLANFRAPMDERGLLPAIEDLLSRIQSEAGIAAYLQKPERRLSLTPGQEVHVLHIVQEALLNVRKYSRAQNVRVMIRQDEAGVCRVLVEDDGVGFQAHTKPARPGERIGLDIMKERATSLGGALTIDSDPGEGTRVELEFPSPPASSPGITSLTSG